MLKMGDIFIATFLVFLLPGMKPVQAEVTYACSFEDDCRDDFKLDGWLYQGPSRYVMDRDSFAGQYAEMFGRGGFDSVHSIEGTLNFPGSQNCLEMYSYTTNHHWWWNCTAAMSKVEVDCGDGFQTKYEEKKSYQNYRKIWHHIAINMPRGECKVKVSVSKPVLESKDRRCHDVRVALDDIKIHNQACPNNPDKYSSSLVCNFNDGLCQWKASGEGAGEVWKHISDHWTTKTRGTGPENRHRLEYSRSIGNHAGNYLYLDSSKFPNKMFSLESPVVRSSTPQCLRMFANMNGKDIGHLRVYIVENNREKSVVEKTGEQGKEWFEIKIDLPVNIDYKIKISVDSNGYLGDIALDNFYIQDGSCQQKLLSSFQPLEESKTYEIENRRKNRPCNYEETKEEGKDVLIFNQQNCNDGHVNFRLKLPANIVTPRKSCFAFSYRFTSTGCAIRIHQVWNGKKKGHWFKKYFFDQPQNDWNTAKVTLDYTTYGVEHQVVMEFHVRHWGCRNVELREVEITDGMCENEDHITPVSNKGSLFN